MNKKKNYVLLVSANKDMHHRTIREVYTTTVWIDKIQVISDYKVKGVSTRKLKTRRR